MFKLKHQISFAFLSNDEFEINERTFSRIIVRTLNSPCVPCSGHAAVAVAVAVATTTTPAPAILTERIETKTTK